MTMLMCAAVCWLNEGHYTCYYDKKSECQSDEFVCTPSKTVTCKARVQILGEWNPVLLDYRPARYEGPPPEQRINVTSY